MPARPASAGLVATRGTATAEGPDANAARYPMVAGPCRRGGDDSECRRRLGCLKSPSVEPRRSLLDASANGIELVQPVDWEAFVPPGGTRVGEWPKNVTGLRRHACRR